jgi:hypothetical protein
VPLHFLSEKWIILTDSANRFNAWSAKDAAVRFAHYSGGIAEAVP